MMMVRLTIPWPDDRVNALPRVGGGSSVSSSRLGHATPRGVAGPMSDRSVSHRSIGVCSMPLCVPCMVGS